MGIAKSIPATIAGSAVAAFGFSLGRDIYKGTKKGSENFLIIAAIAICILAIVIPALGIYYGCLWIARNYRSRITGVIWRVTGAGTLFVSLVSGYLPHAFVAKFLAGILEFSHEGPPVGPKLLAEIDTYLFMLNILVLEGKISTEEAAAFPAIAGYIPVLRWTLISFLCFLGILRGLRQRSARRQAWEAEDHNVGFMHAIGLVELPDGQYKDSWGNMYRIENRLNNIIEFFAIGRRNRRAYLEVDKAGRFVDWSGLTTKRA